MAKGLKDLFGHTGRTIHAYSNKSSSIQYLALRPEEQPPEHHPIHHAHRRVGYVDLERMEIVSAKGSYKTEDDSPQTPLIDIAFKLIKYLFIAVIAIAWMIAAVFMAIAGSSRR